MSPARCRRAVVVSSLLLVAAGSSAEVTIRTDAPSPLEEFAAKEIEAALKARGETPARADWSAPKHGGSQVVLALAENTAGVRDLVRAGATRPGELRNEGFSLRRTGSGDGQTVWVIGEGPGGVMYGGLELAEQIRVKGLGGVEAMDRNPSVAMRGAKFNAPLDVRTPSYTDASDSAQQNIATVWDFDFWTAYLDALARDRYNFVSLWSLHPFPSMVKVPEYPDVALADVQRSTAHWAENYSTRAEDIAPPAILARVETLKKMTIEDKIGFWQRVMRYAKDRNIDFYVVTWNIYTYGTGGKYGITDDIANPVTADYFRRSVTQLFRTYPLLAGIGVTAGENIGNASSSFEAKEDWLFATYGQGVLDALREQPGRKIRFIHRQHETRTADITRTFAPLVGHPDVDFVFSFKYAQAHALSSTTQTFHHEFAAALGTEKTLWTLRNDDALMFRWGAPDFVRKFLQNMPRDVTQGVYYGSDMWVWGREFLSPKPAAPRQLEVDKHWLDWLLWGRLSYDPTLDNDRIVALIALRFPGAPARMLFDAWQHASLIYPLTTGFHWGQYDFQWYIEACKSRPGPARTTSGFHDVNRFITLAPHPGTDNISIPHYVDAITTGAEIKGTTPEAVAADLQMHSRQALIALDRLDAKGDRELAATLADIRAMALLGAYYGYKIRGATELALYRKTGKAEHRQTAVDQLTLAADSWERYTTQAAALYNNPLWTNRVGYVDWQALKVEVAHDIEIAREAVP